MQLQAHQDFYCSALLTALINLQASGHCGATVVRQWSGSQSASAAAVDAPAATVQPQLAPNQSLYDAADPRLREAAQVLQRALGADSVQEEEALWTEIIERYGGLDANWVPDLVGRAWGNRGNARSRQGKLQEALSDYNRSIQLCPWGVVLEALGRFEEAIQDYRAVLAAAPNDPAAWNNLGNATAGAGRWGEAVGYYDKAAKLSPQFSFAQANRALALYQAGDDGQAIREMRSLLRKYPNFPDMRAALAAALWDSGEEAKAEGEWQRVDDPRYRDREWLRVTRRWPPRLVGGMEALLDLRGA
ncbi:hypothetical protein N2152v2_005071 [Parachlorella kessleri]